MKTAANILGDALFACGYEVQDAPRYGAERRGAPMVAYVRASERPIVERGAIVAADLVVVADASLLGMAAAGVTQGATEATTLLVNTSEASDAVRSRTQHPGRVLAWPAGFAIEAGAHAAILSAACAGAAARLLGVVSREALAQAIEGQSAGRDPARVRDALASGWAAYDAMRAHAGCVVAGAEHGVLPSTSPDWIRLLAEDAAVSAPDIFDPATSTLAMTGAWRTHRPVIDYEHCNRCSWVCSTLCPDSAIRVEADRTPRIDYDHCKGCMVCVMACPPHAIRQVSEHAAAAGEA